MRLFNTTRGYPRKRWSITLKQGHEVKEVKLVAVDANSGDEIVELVCFFADGVIWRLKGAEAQLDAQGYDPYEHGNNFDNEGAILIK